MSAAPMTKVFSQAAARTPKHKKASPSFSIRFTEAERAQLERDAGALSLAAYIRLKLFAGEQPPPTRRKPTSKKYVPSTELAVLGAMLGRLGQSQLALNVGELAKAAKMGALPVTPELEQELLEACSAIQDMREQLISGLGVKVR